jgi:hypothetical protein
MPAPIPGAGRAPMTLPKSVVRIGEQAIWSSQRYGAGDALASTENRVFTTPRGQVGQGFALALTLAETSLKEGGRIPGGFAFSVDAMALHPYYIGGAEGQSFAVTGADLRNLQANCVLSWDFLQTRIDIAPAVLIGAGGGVFGSTADTGAAEGNGGGSRIALNHGAANVWLYRRSPVMLPADATFAVVLQWGVNASAVDGGDGNSALVLRTHLMGQFETAIAVG